MRNGWWLATTVALSTIAACMGTIGGDGADGTGAPSAETLGEIGISGARRLTAAEFDASVRDLYGVGVVSELALPEDLRTPYDNDYTQQIASEALITAAESLAGDIAREVVADPALREAIVPCVPSGADDAACFRAFVSRQGRRAFRRPLSEEEVEAFMGLMAHAEAAGDFWTAIDSAVRALVQHPFFLYRVELGAPVAGTEGVFRLSDYELAARMSYLFLGSTTPDWLLDEVATGSLANAAGVRAAADKLLEDDRALATVARFHAMWLGYERLPHGPTLAAAMHQETAALLERVLLEERAPWTEILLAKETYLTADLAEHYGLPAPAGGEGWVAYGDSGRQGLLSQGSFLSAVAKFDDTSPTQRGLLIRARLFCQEIHSPPPDLMVDTDNPPTSPDPDACKADKYDMWKTDGCKMCHALMEPVGFGLENYDMAGRYREHEPNRPDCPIDGAGALEGIGSFEGPAQLSDLIVETGDVDACIAEQLYRFAAGRYALDGRDLALVSRVTDRASASDGLRFDRLLVELVSSEAFRHRREEVTP